jgi:hypothetical protein
VTRVELRDIVPSKAVQDSMELQMAAERKKRAAVLTSEGERESAVNSAKGRAESSVLASLTSLIRSSSGTSTPAPHSGHTMRWFRIVKVMEPHGQVAKSMGDMESDLGMFVSVDAG